MLKVPKWSSIPSRIGRLHTCAIQELRARGMIANTTIKEGELLGRDSSIYAGFDPTAPSLHVGNLLALISLVHFASKGHSILSILGGATGRIGDPSWRSTSKIRLGESAIETNLRSLKKQLESFLPKALHLYSKWNSVDTNDCKFEILDNFEWYKKMNVIGFLDTVGSKMRVASMISRDSVRNRMDSEMGGNGLSFSELSYQVLQAYDFSYLHKKYNCQLQIGGSDQWGNIVSGLDLIHKNGHLNAHGLTIPLFVTSSGEKMGKSAGNAKWLDPSMTAPFDLYQYFSNLSDDDCVKLLPMLSLRPLDEIHFVISEHRNKPDERRLQKALAFDTTALVHSQLIAQQCKSASDILFGKQALHNNIDSDVLDDLQSALEGSTLVHHLESKDTFGVRLVDLLVKIYPDRSKNHFRNLIKGGAVEINGRRIEDPLYSLQATDFTENGQSLLKTGRQTFAFLILSLPKINE